MRSLLKLTTGANRLSRFARPTLTINARFLFACTVCANLLFGISLASADNAISTNTAVSVVLYKNNLRAEKDTPDVLLVNGNDPHVILAIDSSWRRASKLSQDALNANILTIPLRLDIPYSDNVDTVDRPKLELFFKVSPKTKGHYPVDSNYRLVYVLPALDTEGGEDLLSKTVDISLLIPAPINVAAGSLVRLDVDGCINCSFSQIKQPDTAGESTPSGEAFALEPFRVMNGIEMLSSIPEAIPLNQWELRNLEDSGSALIPLLTDPYLVSPLMGLDTESLAGIVIDFEAFRISSNASAEENQTNTELLEFQVFHADNHHQINARYSSQVRMSLDLPALVNPLARSEKCTQRLFILLDHIKDERSISSVPEKVILARLRIDLPSKLDLGWNICSIMMVPTTLRDEMHGYEAPLVSHSRYGRSRGLQLVNAIVDKLLKDWPFMLSLFGIIALVCWRTIKSFRR